MAKRKVQSILFYCAASNEKFFLLLKMNERRDFLWQNVTGSVEDIEGYQDGAIREAVEETGLCKENILAITQSDLEFRFTDQWQQEVIEKVFFIQCQKKWPVILDPSEHCQFNWLSEKEIVASSVHYPSNFSALQAAVGLRV